MRSPHPTTRWRDAEPHGVAALLTALLLPGLMTLWVTGWRVGHDVTAARLPAVVTRLVFVDAPDPPPPAAPDTMRDAAPPAPRAALVRPRAQQGAAERAARDPQVSEVDTPTAAAPGTALDYGNLLGASAGPVAIAETLPWARTPSRADAAPERFRMRRQITPADVVRGFSQLVGLWPPGYTDSPCPALRRTIDSLSQAPSLSDLDHALLQDAVQARSRYCA